jgi:hypothetical protein
MSWPHKALSGERRHRPFGTACDCGSIIHQLRPGGLHWWPFAFAAPRQRAERADTWPGDNFSKGPVCYTRGSLPPSFSS